MTSTVKGSNVASVVVLTGKLSNPGVERRLATFTPKEPGETPVQRPHPKPVRRRKVLEHEELEMLTTQYAAGRSVKQLAASYDIHHTTVSALLKDRGVRLRQTSLSPDQIELATKLRAEGWSNVRIAGHLGCGAETIRRRLGSVAPHRGG